MSIYIWSDLHLNHSNIIKYENRPFRDIEEMNDTLLNNWKKTITKHDTIINLGDVSFKCSKEFMKNIISNMPGKKILVLGNHDKARSVKWWHDVGFDIVYPYPFILDDFYILSHEPIYINDNMPYVNIHGHTHSDISECKQKVNVCVENINYIPISFESIKKRFN